MRPFSPERPALRLSLALTALLCVTAVISLPAQTPTATFARAEGVLSLDPTTTYYGIAVGPTGAVYVAAGSKGILEFPPNGPSPVPFGILAPGVNITSLSVDPATGNVYAADAANTQIDVITPLGIATQLTVNSSTSIEAGQVYVANNLLYIAGTGGVVSVPLAGGTATSLWSDTRFNAVAADTHGNVYIASASLQSVGRIDRSNRFSAFSVISAATWSAPQQLAVDTAGNLYVADNTGNTSDAGQLVMITTPSSSPSASNAASVDTTFAQVAPYGVAVDAHGNVYWTNQGLDLPLNPINVVGTASATFPSQLVGAPGNTISFLFNIPGCSATLGTPQVLTSGATGADFTNASDTCHGTVTGPATCAVNVTFAPSSSGLKRGAVVLVDGSNVPVATVYMQGWGASAAIAFPPVYKTVATFGDYSLGGIASDGTDLYVADNHAVRRIKIAGGASDGNLALNGSSALDLQLDGAGNLWVADSTGVEEAVRQGDGTYAAFSTVISTGESTDLLVDSLGNVFIIASGSGNVLEYPVAGGGPITISSASANGLGMDASGNLYYSVSNVPQEVAAQALNGTASPAATALTGISAILDYTFDAAGDLYTISPSTGLVVEYPSVNGALSTTSIALTAEDLASFSGITLDAAGNLYATDDNTIAAVEYAVSTAPTFAFGSQNQNSTSAAKSTTLTNIGNVVMALGIPAASLTTTQFAIDSSTTCAITSPVLPGGACTLAATFTPTTSGSPTDTLTINSNALPAPGTIALSGTSVANTPTISLAEQGTLTYGSTISVAVTASGSSGAPTGSISWTLDGVSQTAVALSGGTATLTPASLLAVGSHTFVITYPGDATYTALASDPSETITFAVAKAAITVTASSPAAITYGDGAPTVTGTASPTLFGGDTIASIGITCSAATITGALTTTTTCSGSPANYTVTSFIAGSFNVNREPITVTASNAAAINYGDPLPLVTGSVTVGALVGHDTLASIGILCSAESVTGAGQGVTACGGPFPQNYVVTEISGAFTVNPDPITVTASSTTMVAGTTVPAISGTLTGGMLVGSDALANVSTCSAAGVTSASPAGIYPTSCTNTSTNYAVTSVAGTLTVTPAPVAVPPTNVGSTSASFPVAFLFTTATTVTQARVGSGGAADYASTDTAQCVGSFNPGTFCTVDVTFTPGAPGVRPGAVALYDSRFNQLQVAYLNGRGLGALLTSPTPTATVIPDPDSVVAVGADAGGNLFAGQTDLSIVTLPRGQNQSQVAVSSAGTVPVGIAFDGNATMYVARQTAFIAPFANLPFAGYTRGGNVANSQGATAVATDGSGNLYYVGASAGVTMVTPSGAVSTVPGAGSDVYATVAVDGTGNVYAGRSGNGAVLRKFPAGGGDPVALDTSTLGISSLAVDAAGDVFENTNEPESSNVNEIPASGGNFVVGQQSDVSGAPAVGITYDGFGAVVATSQTTGLVRYDLAAAASAAITFSSSTVVGQQSQASRVFINGGNTPLTFSSITAGTVNFSLDSSSTCNTSASIAPGTSCNLIVDFTPTTGDFTATSSVSTLNDTLTVVSDSTSQGATGETISIPLSGNATPGPETITFPAPANVTYGAAPITLSATSTNSGAGSPPVVFAVKSGPATLGTDGVTLTITGAGPVTVHADQADDAAHAAATEVSQTFTVGKAQLTVTANDATRVYGAANPAFTYTVTGFVYSDTAANVPIVGTPTLSASATADVHSSPTPISVDVTGMSAANYTFTPVAGALTITQATQTITFTPLNIVGAVPIGGTVLLSATGGASGSSVTFAVTPAGIGTVTGNILTVNAAGTLTVTANQAGDSKGDYAAATSVSQTFSTGSANVTLDQQSLTFGSQAITTKSAYQGIALQSNGTAGLQLTGVKVTGPFAALGCPLGTYAIRIGCELQVQFVPTATGGVTGTITLTDSAPDSPQVIQLTGTGTAPGITFSPTTIDFGSIEGGSILIRSLKITNTGNADLHLSIPNIVNLTGNPSFSYFSRTLADEFNCATVAAGSSCSLEISFTPDLALQTDKATIVFSDDTPSGSDTVVVSGTSVAGGISLAPTNLNFPPTVVGSTTGAETVTFTYTGGSPLTNIAIAEPGDFAVDGSGTTCGTVLTPITPGVPVSCNISLTATPSAAGMETGDLTITDSLGTQTVALSVSGLAASANLSATQLQFSGVQVGTVSDAQSVQLSNLGGADLTGIQLSVSAGFQFNSPCAASLAPGKSCGVNVSFAPTGVGPASGTLTVTDSAGTQTVELSGIGQAAGLTFSPAVLGVDVLANSQSFAPPLETGTLTNTGTVPLTFTMGTTGGVQQDDTDLLVEDTGQAGCFLNGLENTLNPGTSCQFGFTTPSSDLGAIAGTITATAGNLTATAQVAASEGAASSLVSRSELLFGSTPVGATGRAQSVTVSGVDAAGAFLMGMSAPFSVSAPSTTGDFTITSTTCANALLDDTNKSCAIDVAMAPTSLGEVTGTLTLQSSNGPFTIPLSGSGSANHGVLLPSNLEFGSVPASPKGVQTAINSVARTSSLVNPNQVAIAITNITISGPFVQTNNCGAGVAPNGFCNVSVRFVPTVSGYARGVLTATDNLGNTMYIALSGYGSPSGITLTPANLEFGSVSPGKSSAPLPVVLANKSGSAINSLGITASGQYSLSSDCGATLENNSSCTLQVTLTPSLSDAVTGAIGISGSLATANSGRQPRPSWAAPRPPDATTASPIFVLAVEVLDGTGSPASLSLSAPALTFASQAVGATSATQAVTITNTGGAALTGLALTSTPDFPLTSTCTATLAAGANCTATVAFDPVAAGNRTGDVSITADGGVTANVALSGEATGGQLQLDPSSLSYAAIPIATQSFAQTLSVSNIGTAALQLQSLTVAGAGFALNSSTCGTLPASLAAGAACALTVSYTPATTAAATGSLTATSDSGNAIIALSGSGTNAGLAFSATSFTFGNQGVGLASAAQTLTLTNASGAAVAITSIAGGGDFAETNNCPATLANGANCAVQITFTPTAMGAAAGSLTVTDGGITQMAALSGTGTEFTMALGGGQASQLTIAAGNSGSFQIALTPGSFSGAVTLACSGLPAGTTCTATPSPVTLAAGGAATTVTVTITTTARGAVPPAPSPFVPPMQPWLWFTLAAVLAASALAVGRRRRLVFGLLMLGALAAAGCGGVTNEPTADGGTPAGTYPVVVTATAGAASQMVQVTITVL